MAGIRKVMMNTRESTAAVLAKAGEQAGQAMQKAGEKMEGCSPGNAETTGRPEKRMILMSDRQLLPRRR
jgi:hypothetical protein